MMLAGPAACRSGQRVLAALRRPLSASAGCASTSCTATRTTLNWVDNWVVGQKLCPFAKPLRSADALRIAITHATTEDGVCASFADELGLIEQGILAEDGTATEPGSRKGHSFPESTLLVLASSATDDAHYAQFPEFNRLSWALQDVVVTHGLVDKVQIVLFHPDAVHSLYSMDPDDTVADVDPKAFAIRSPYPTIHLLREKDVLQAVQTSNKPELIPANNARRLATMQERTGSVQGQWTHACAHAR